MKTASRPHHLNLQQVRNLQYCIYMFYFPMCCKKIYFTHWDKGIKHASPSEKGFHGIFAGIKNHQKGYLVYAPHKRKIASSYNLIFDESFSNTLVYMSQTYAEAMAMRCQCRTYHMIHIQRNKLAI